MASDVTQIEKLAEEPMAVDLGAIEAELDRIWIESTGSGQDESSIRLRVLNFLGVGPETPALDRFEEVMGVLPQHHPCRGILLVTAPDQSGVNASIAAHCWRASGGGRHLCSEEVLLRGGNADARALASTALALLVPELPVTLWLIGGDALGSQLSAELIGAADRVFVDTADAADLRDAMRAVVRAERDHDGMIGDLAWGRCASWRVLCAQFFDSSEGAAELAQLQRIEIVSGGERPSPEAMLMAGWFVSCLGLSLADLSSQGSTLEATLYEASRAVTIAISCDAARIEPLAAVRLKTPHALFSLQVHEESAHIHVRADWDTVPIHRTVAQVPTDDASIFAEILDDASAPAVYVDAVRSALTLLGD